MPVEPLASGVDDRVRVQLGDVLVKALCDPFDYVVRLRSGELIRFVEAEQHGDWLVLHTAGGYGHDDFSPTLPFPCPRGLQVRISEIVWVADAPEGS